MRTLPSITRRDEDLITWYYLHGERQFQRSTHGAMVTRLILDSMGSCRCRVCGGVGILEDDVAVRRHQERGKRTELRRSWRLVSRRGEVGLDDQEVISRVEVRVGSYCQLCGGTGSVPQKEQTRHCGQCERREGEPLDAWRQRRRACSWCLGSGVARITAAPTIPARDAAGGINAAEQVLRKFARVSRRLDAVPAHHRRILELYYGPHGQSWADQPGGRLLALQEFTRAGRILLRRTRVADDEATHSTNAERIAAQMLLQRSQPKAWRATLLASAAEQASQLHREAVGSWVAVSGGLDLAALRRRIGRTGRAYAAWLDRNRALWEE